MMYELRDVNDKLIKEITYKEMVEKLNNHEAGKIKENKRIVGCRLQEEVIKDNIEVAENDDLPDTKKIIIRTIIGAPLFLSFFLMVIFMKEICCLLAGLLIFAIPSFLSLTGSAIRYCFVREVYDTYKGKK